MGTARSAAGRDVVNHGINDIGVLNARPLAFLDYIASSELEAETVLALVEGMAEACRAAGVALIGGETAQMPDTYRAGAYDVAGTMIGVAERVGACPTRRACGSATASWACPRSASTPTATASPARRRRRWAPTTRSGEGTLADALLAPHPSYYAELAAAFAVPGVRVVAHITGGGLEENVPRVLPDGVGARFDVGSWAVPPVFDVIAADQDVDPAEMYRVFNMGIGLAIVVAARGRGGAAAGRAGLVPRPARSSSAAEPRVVLAGL